MALQTTRLFIKDALLVPIQGANVSFHRISTAQSFFATTDVNGKAELPLEEDVYTVAAAAEDYVAPAAVRFEVSPPPAPTSALYNPPSKASYPAVSPTTKNIKLAIDGAAPVTIDVTNGVGTVTSVADIVNNINLVLGLPIAYQVYDEVRLQSSTTGASSSVAVYNDGSFVDSAVVAVFGQIPAGITTVTGEDTPTDWNDFDMTFTPYGAFAATDPDHCVLYGKFYRHELSAPMTGASVWVEVLSRPAAVDVGIDTGDSFYATTDEDGVLHFEVMRGCKLRLYLQWQDKAFEFTVPDAPAADLAGLLTPYVVSINSLLLNPTSMVVGASLSYSGQAVFTDGSKKLIVANNDYALQRAYSSSDQATVSIDANGIVKALQTGTATLTMTCRNTKNQLITSSPVTVVVT